MTRDEVRAVLGDEQYRAALRGARHEDVRAVGRFLARLLVLVGAAVAALNCGPIGSAFSHSLSAVLGR